MDKMRKGIRQRNIATYRANFLRSPKHNLQSRILCLRKIQLMVIEGLCGSTVLSAFWAGCCVHLPPSSIHSLSMHQHYYQDYEDRNTMSRHSVLLV